MKDAKTSVAMVLALARHAAEETLSLQPRREGPVLVAAEERERDRREPVSAPNISASFGGNSNARKLRPRHPDIVFPEGDTIRSEIARELRASIVAVADHEVRPGVSLEDVNATVIRYFEQRPLPYPLRFFRLALESREGRLWAALVAKEGDRNALRKRSGARRTVEAT